MNEAKTKSQKKNAKRKQRAALAKDAKKAAAPRIKQEQRTLAPNRTGINMAKARDVARIPNDSRHFIDAVTVQIYELMVLAFARTIDPENYGWVPYFGFSGGQRFKTKAWSMVIQNPSTGNNGGQWVLDLVLQWSLANALLIIQPVTSAAQFQGVINQLSRGSTYGGFTTPDSVGAVSICYTQLKNSFFTNVQVNAMITPETLSDSLGNIYPLSTLPGLNNTKIRCYTLPPGVAATDSITITQQVQSSTGNNNSLTYQLFASTNGTTWVACSSAATAIPALAFTGCAGALYFFVKISAVSVTTRVDSILSITYTLNVAAPTATENGYVPYAPSIWSSTVPSQYMITGMAVLVTDTTNFEFDGGSVVAAYTADSEAVFPPTDPYTAYGTAITGKQWDYYRGDYRLKGLYAFMRHPGQAGAVLTNWGIDSSSAIYRVPIQVSVPLASGQAGALIQVFGGVMYTTDQAIEDPYQVAYCTSAENMAHEFVRGLSPFTENPLHKNKIMSALKRVASAGGQALKPVGQALLKVLPKVMPMLLAAI